jgi:hypothetical protein
VALAALGTGKSGWTELPPNAVRGARNLEREAVWPPGRRLEWAPEVVSSASESQVGPAIVGRDGAPQFPRGEWSTRDSSFTMRATRQRRVEDPARCATARFIHVVDERADSF